MATTEKNTAMFGHMRRPSVDTEEERELLEPGTYSRSPTISPASTITQLRQRHGSAAMEDFVG